MSSEEGGPLRPTDSDEDEDVRWSGAFERVFGKDARKLQHQEETEDD